MRTNIIINNSTLEQTSRFKYLGCAVSCVSQYDIKEKINKFSNFHIVFYKIHRNLRNITRHSTRIKFYKTTAIPTLTGASAVSYTHLDVYKRQIL